MGMKYSFNSSKIEVQFDAISATANAGGFTPLTSIARHYRWDSKLINAASKMCNNNKEIAILNEISPILLLVPQTKGVIDGAFLISDLFKACSAAKVETLRFTHFCFTQGRLPEKEIEEILRYIKDNCSSNGPDLVVWDIDSRKQEGLLKIYKNIFLAEPEFLEAESRTA